MLQPSIEQGDASNNTSVDSNFDAVDTRILRRSKRVVEELEVILFLKDVWDLGIELNDSFYPAKRHSERHQNEALSLEELERHVMHNDLSRKLSKNYWAIDRSYDLLSGNRGLLLANQGLLLANTGLLIDVAFMLMNINSKIDRNYEAILRVENKVDRNLEVMLLRFKILEYNLTNLIERRFKEVIDFVRQTRIEGVTSELITFIRHFIQEKDSIRNLTHDQYVTKLEEINGILHRLQNSRMPQSGSLHTLLYNIINQRFAISENSNDRVALTELGLLCSGTETYTSVMSFLLEE